MNYKKHYDLLITRAKHRVLTGYKESHHVIPRCMDGTDDPENLVELTAREHFVAHLLLLKIYPTSFGLVKAVQMMCCASENQDRSMNRFYGWLRDKFSTEMSRSQSGERNSQFGTKWVFNTELRESKKIPGAACVPSGWSLGRVMDFESYEMRVNRVLEKENYKKLSKEKRKRELENKRNEKRIENEQYKDFIVNLYSDFKSGNYYSVSEFHKKNDISVSRMTLTNYWKKWIPEYAENSKEGKRFSL